MALDPKLLIDYYADTDTAKATDDTTYGGANPLRADRAVFLYVYKKDINKEKVAVTTTDNLDPVNVITWDFATAKDGHYQAQYMDMPIHNADDTFEEDDYVWDEVTARVYLVLQTHDGQTPGTDTAFFELVDEPITITDVPNGTWTLLEFVVVAKNDVNSAILTAYAVENGCKNCEDEKFDQAMHMRLYANAMYLAEGQEKYYKADLIARDAQELADATGVC
jgi:hypothetical protein